MLYCSLSSVQVFYYFLQPFNMNRSKNCKHSDLVKKQATIPFIIVTKDAQEHNEQN